MAVIHTTWQRARSREGLAARLASRAPSLGRARVERTDLSHTLEQRRTGRSQPHRARHRPESYGRRDTSPPHVASEDLARSSREDRTHPPLGPGSPSPSPDLSPHSMLSPPLLAHYKELQMGLSHLCREGDRATGASVWDWIPGELLVPDAPAQASPEYTLSVL